MTPVPYASTNDHESDRESHPLCDHDCNHETHPVLREMVITEDTGLTKLPIAELTELAIAIAELTDLTIATTKLTELTIAITKLTILNPRSYSWLAS